MKPWVMISLGVAREFAGEPHFTTYRLAEPFVVGAQRVEGLGLRIFNYTPGFAPAGKTVIQVAFETEWDHWNDLRVKDRGAYEAEKARVAAEALRRLEAHYPGLSAQVEMIDVATPYTTWRYTLNWQGRVRGLAADRQPDDDGPAAHAARPDGLCHGRAVGHTGGRRADVLAFRSRCRAHLVQARREALHRGPVIEPAGRSDGAPLRFRRESGERSAERLRMTGRASFRSDSRRQPISCPN